MHRFKTIAIVVAFIMVFSLLTIIPTNADGQLFKVQLGNKATNFDSLHVSGVSIVEEYDNFAICNIAPNIVPSLESDGFVVNPFIPFTEVSINDYKLIADGDRILRVSPELPNDLTIPNIMPMGDTHYIVQFDLPIKNEWTENIRANGAKIQGYLPDGGIIIKASANEVSKLHSWGRVIGGTPLHPGLKIANTIQADEENLVKITVNLYSDEKISDVRNLIPGECFDGSIEKEYGSINIECEAEDIASIAWIEAVSSITPYVEPELFMDRSREIMGIEARSDDSSPSLEARSEGVWDYGLRGQGRVACVQDTGCDTGNLATLNRDFGIPPRIVGHFGYNSAPAGPDPTQSKDWSDYNGHGTFTSGQVMGDGYNSPLGQYSGVAPEAGLVVQRGLGYLNPGLPDSYGLGARVHSNSWGSSIDTYTAECQYTDQFVWDNPDMVVCISAGNSGPGTSTLGTPSVAKNDMSVAAGGNNRPSTSLTNIANPGDTILWVTSNAGFNLNASRSNRVMIAGDNPGEDEFRTYTARIGGNRIRIDAPLTYSHSVGRRVHEVHAEVVARFSSRGPTPDTRIKPDITGPGANVMGIEAYTTTYSEASGTSMSCPNVAGCSVLAQQWLDEVELHGEPSAALVKALLLNGSRDIREDYDGTPLFTPSYIGGWGYVDLYDTLFPTAPTRRDYSDYKPGVVTGQRVGFPIMAGPGTFKVNLVWSDYPSIPGALTHLVNDLDLVVESPGGDIYRGNQYVGGIGFSSDSEINATSTDTANNVEGVTINNSLETGMYMVYVDAANVPQGPQPFAVSIEYEAIVPDFDVRVTPDLVDIDSDWRTGTFPVDVTPIAGFTGDVALSCSLIPAELNSSFNPNSVYLNIDTETSILTLSTSDQLPVGTYYIIVRGTSGNLYHEDIITIRVRPGPNYKFDFIKDVGKGGIGNTHGDNGVMVYPSEKLGYSMQYNLGDMDLFAEMTVEDAIPMGAYYNGKAFPIPTHYSADNGNTWINERIPDGVGYGYRMRWDIHNIPGSGHLMRLSTGIPGYDNVSDDIESSTQQVMEIDSMGYPHVVWSNHILGSFPSDDEIFYTKWNGNEWVDLQGDPGISNISNTAATISANPDMFIDDLDNPHFIWKEDELSVHHCYWNGSSLVKLDGTAGTDILTTGLNSSYRYYSPRIEQGENGDISVVFSYYMPGGWVWNGMWWTYVNPAYGLYFTKVSGGIWTQLDGVTPGAQQELNSGNWTSSPTLAVDSNGDTYAGIETREWFWWFIIDDSLLVSKWNSATNNWTHFNGVTPGWEDMVPTIGLFAVAHSNAELKMQTGDIPHLTWMDEQIGSSDIIYTRFDGGQWVTANGTPGYENITNSALIEDNPYVCLQPDGRPALIWEEQSDSTNIRFSWFNAGWRDLFNNGGSEAITDIDSESILPNAQIDNSGTPFFSFVDNRTGDDDVYVTYPVLEYENANFPGEIIWEAKINDEIPTGVNAIVNNAYISGVYIDGATNFETTKTKSTTSNPFKTKLRVSKTADKSNVRVNEKIEYTIVVTNEGSIALTDVSVNDYMPKGMEYISSRPEAKIRTNGVYWIINKIEAGSSVTLKVWAKITDERLNGKVVQNKVAVTASNANVKAEDYSSVIVTTNTSGFPAPDATFKVNGDAKSNSDTEFILQVWSGNGPFSFKIDWGDGDSTSGNAELKTPKTLIHSYGSPGEYKIECEVSDRYGVTKLIEYKVQVN